MDLYTYFKSIEKEEIERFVKEGQEENIYLEFKTANHPNYNDSNRDYDRNNFSVCLSGFANSNGGIIIWGIKASKNASGQDVAKKLEPISELTKFLNLLNKIEGQAIMPTVLGVEHSKIEISNDAGYIKSFIPASTNPPHMSVYGGKYYYKRSGDSFYQCEHFDIVDLFSRRKYPKLSLLTKIQKVQARGNVGKRYFVVISIKNEGQNIAKYPFLAIRCNSAYSPSAQGLDGDKNTGLHRVANNVSYRYNYGGGSNIVIYPNSILDVDRLVTEVGLNDAPTDLKLEYLIQAEGISPVVGEILLNTRQILSESTE